MKSPQNTIIWLTYHCLIFSSQGTVLPKLRSALKLQLGMDRSWGALQLVLERQHLLSSTQAGCFGQMLGWASIGCGDWGLNQDEQDEPKLDSNTFQSLIFLNDNCHGIRTRDHDARLLRLLLPEAIFQYVVFLGSCECSLKKDPKTEFRIIQE